MVKRAIHRAVSSFHYAVTLNVVITAILLFMDGDAGFLPVLPEFAARFATPVLAMIVQWLLIGCTGAAFGGFSVLLELERWSLLKQSVIYFVLTSVVWVPVAVTCWGLGTYVSSFVSVITSYSISYAVVWIIQYRTCKHSIEQINQKLAERKDAI
ncbi:MAG: DUF3021 domain-containing protein [Lachnospiraceae bacterium]|nr:DUF3021 domain-containing protein [Lachnospiraceae bacterium]MDD3795294.1 DUF3021 domain-containing protein [Lachnospiraceae bacterium]